MIQNHGPKIKPHLNAVVPEHNEGRARKKAARELTAMIFSYAVSPRFRSGIKRTGLVLVRPD